MDKIDEVIKSRSPIGQCSKNYRISLVSIICFFIPHVSNYIKFSGKISDHFIYVNHMNTYSGFRILFLSKSYTI